MAILFKSAWDDAGEWTRCIQAEEPELEVRVWPEVGEAADIEFALVWEPPPGDLKRYPNLKAIFSLAAGVDHILGDPELPEGVPIVRMVDKSLTAQMSEYAIYHVLRYHRNMHLYESFQRERRWEQLPHHRAQDRRVGMLGIGVLGQDAGRKLQALGFDVLGWRRAARPIDGIETFHGPDGLTPFLNRTDILICLLPLTPATRGILNAGTFAALPEGAFVINMARGGHLVEEDLIGALGSGQPGSGHLAGATLDVFREEPLPPDHPFWRHPRITVTPHIASLTDARSGAQDIIDNIRRLRAGAPVRNLVDPETGY